MKRWFILYVIIGLILVIQLIRLISGKLDQSFALNSNDRKFEFTYSFTVKEIPSDADRIYAWISIPPTNDQQRLEKFTIENEGRFEIVSESEYGNRFFLFDLSETVSNGDGNPSVTIKYYIIRKAYNVLTKKDNSTSLPRINLNRFLSPDRLIPIDGKIAEEAARIAGDVLDPLVQSRRIYDHIIRTVMYDLSGDSWGKGDAIYACDFRTGNCSDFHSLFIGQVRSLNIPARFNMGFPLPENENEGIIPGYHCWAEFWIDSYGWIPVDASGAHKNPEKIETFFGGLDKHRIQFSLGRDINIPMAEAGPVNFIIYPYVEVNGKPYNNIDTKYSFRDIDI